MKTRISVEQLAVFALAGSLATACDEAPDLEPSPYDELVGDVVGDDGRVNWREVIDNGKQQNGFRFNGFRFNGFRFNGFRFNGFRFNGFRFNGNALNNVQMNGNKIRGEEPDTTVVEGADLEDARIDVDFEDPQDSNNTAELEYSMTEAETLASGLVVNTVKYREKPSGTWVNSCENGAKAVQLKGDWDLSTGNRITTDPNANTWACLGAAIGDCAAWGYIPGNLHNATPLDDFHETCTRLKRADYCGNGTHHTENGHSIDVYDALDIQQPATVGLWDVEAMWGPDGAVCMNFTRKLDYTKDINDNTKIYIGCEIPDCEDINQDGVIDFADYPTAYVADRTVPAWKTE